VEDVCSLDAACIPGLGKGYRVAERVLPRSDWTLSYADVVFFLSWRIEQLVRRVLARTA
jgi:hypothetical protein